MPDIQPCSLRLEDASVAYGKTEALSQCSLEVRAGELLCVVGPSGCGKSTLLKLLAGFLESTTGKVEIGGRDVRGVPVGDRHIAYIMDRLGLYPHLSVFDNVAYPLRVRRSDSANIKAKVTEICALVGISGLEGRRPHELSAGQRQRVAIARALVRDDAVALFADESFSSLDAQLRYRLRTEFRTWQRARNLTCVFVTHDQEEALSLGDRIALMSTGRIEQIGTAKQVYDDPQSVFAATFFGRPPCNIVPMRNDGELTLFGHLFAAAYPNAKLKQSAARNLQLGFRPEAVTVESSHNGDGLTIDWIEPMNPDTVLHMKAGGTQITARSRNPKTFSPGQPVNIAIDPARWLLFDQESGRRCAFPA